MADSGGRRDIAHSGALIAAATELRPRDRSDVGGLVVGLGLLGPTLDGPVGGNERGGLTQLGIRRMFGGKAFHHDPAQQCRHPIRCGVVPHDIETDLQHRLRDPVGEDTEVNVRSDVAAPPPGAQGLVHRLKDGGGPPLRPCDQVGVRAGCFVHGDLYRSAMRHRALCDRRPQRCDLCEPWT